MAKIQKESKWVQQQKELVANIAQNLYTATLTDFECNQLVERMISNGYTAEQTVQYYYFISSQLHQIFTESFGLEETCDPEIEFFLMEHAWKIVENIDINGTLYGSPEVINHLRGVLNDESVKSDFLMRMELKSVEDEMTLSSYIHKKMSYLSDTFNNEEYRIDLKRSVEMAHNAKRNDLSVQDLEPWFGIIEKLQKK